MSAKEESNNLIPSAAKADLDPLPLYVPAAQVDESDSFIKVTGKHETLRQMDLNGDGEITLDEVLAFAKQYETNKKNFKFYKNLALSLLLAVVLLTASNVGTGMLAIEAMKEIKIGGVTTLESVHGGKPLKTEERARHISGLPDVNGEGRRYLEEWEAEMYGLGDKRFFHGCVRGIQLLESLVPGTTVNLITLTEDGMGSIKTMIKPYKIFFPPTSLQSLFVDFDGGLVAEIYDQQRNYTLLAPEDINTNPNSPCAHLNVENSTALQMYYDVDGDDAVEQRDATQGAADLRKLLVHNEFHEVRRKLGKEQLHRFRFSDFDENKTIWDKYGALVSF